MYAYNDKKKQVTPTGSGPLIGKPKEGKDSFTTKVKKDDKPMYAYNDKKKRVEEKDGLFATKPKETKDAFTAKTKKDEAPMYEYNAKKKQVVENEGIFVKKREKDPTDTFALKGDLKKSRKENKYNSKKGKVKKNKGLHNLWGLLKKKEKDKKGDKRGKQQLDLFDKSMF
jgi:hypothetical protein